MVRGWRGGVAARLDSLGGKAVDAMSSELEQLRADLEVIKRLRRQESTFWTMGHAETALTEQIARLEAEAADPWREAKRDIEDSRSSTFEKCQRFIAYVDHLTADSDRLAARVAELEANAVWGIHSQVDGHLIKVFNTRAEAEAEMEKEPPKFRFKEVKVSSAKSIVKALNESQHYENKYRVERDEAWRRIRELGIDAADDPILDRHRTIATVAKMLVDDKTIPDGERLAGALMQMLKAGGAKPYEVCDD